MVVVIVAVVVVAAAAVRPLDEQEVAVNLGQMDIQRATSVARWMQSDNCRRSCNNSLLGVAFYWRLRLTFTWLAGWPDSAADLTNTEARWPKL